MCDVMILYICMEQIDTYKKFIWIVKMTLNVKSDDVSVLWVCYVVLHTDVILYLFQFLCHKAYLSKIVLKSITLKGFI